MKKERSSNLLTVVIILLLLAVIPIIKNKLFDQKEAVTLIQATQAFAKGPDVNTYISTGYVGEYGFTAMPAEKDAQVLGESTNQSSSPPLYQAKEVGRSYPVINLNPGKAITFWVDFLNTGKATWYNNGKNFLAVNVTNPVGRHSLFQSGLWKPYYRPGKLLQTKVKPGQTGRFKFVLQAPATSGIYTEGFNLVADKAAWVDGGYFAIMIGVGQKVSAPPAYQAELSATSYGDSLKLNPGQATTVWVDFKNTGLKTWYKNDEHFIALNVTNPPARHSFFWHKFWPAYYRPAKLMNDRVYPGEVGRFRFALQAPNQVGYYTEDFNLVVENYSFMPGGFLSMPITVGQPYIPPVVKPITNEPTIRIGLYSTAEPIKITASGQYEIRDSSNTLLATKDASEVITVDFSNNIFNINEIIQAPGTYLRLVPQSTDTIMELVNYQNPPVWNSQLNDNKFRGTIELRYSTTTGKLWVINELPLESYLRGLAEVSNGQPDEYLKALIIAARSYALWNIVHGGKHATEYYDINATTDQVYRGYNFEQRSVDPLKAVVATQGQVITHAQAIDELNPQGIALAPYSSGTDGRTRSWQEVWAGEYPWLVSVDDPYGIISNALTLEGNHMVGLSALGARGYATKENKTYDWILKHYYTGVEIQKLY